MREKWTDERLDDLNHKVDDLGRRMDAGFRELRTEMRTELDLMRVKMGANQRTMIHLVGALLAAQIGVIATLVGLILAQS